MYLLTQKPHPPPPPSQLLLVEISSPKNRRWGVQSVRLLSGFPPRIPPQESIPSAYVAWRAGMTILVIVLGRQTT
jgi:hypothetical protein